MTLIDAAKEIVANLNDRSGINIDFDDDIMEDIYQEIITSMVKVAKR